ncbi:hypothetical protein KHS38_20735 [Mucilaginibacter sp. Bleaf8]|uniref:hypothetical protein n=1 Tax=Mucilaginibacter sp. Bleaf8 TaxID=2834430 RepID=UPI001BCF3D47|nr:hypothetical protein [Mucilaginibacter sp. Bleaf8]MBS7566844.1 hypothetical protein [Mucilaginibacter sp. Bleaf8]
MSAEKKTKHKILLQADEIRIDSNSYANDPFFVKKAEKAKEFLRLHPIPEHILRARED